jgi:DNA repair ATPase RecN
MPVRRKVTLEQIYKKLEQHDKQFSSLTKLIFKTEDSLNEKIAKVLERVQSLETLMEKMTGDLETLQQEYYSLTEAVNRIEQTLEATPRKKLIDDENFKQVITRLNRIERHLGLTETVGGAKR